MDPEKIIAWVNEVLHDRSFTQQDFYLLEGEKQELKELLKTFVYDKKICQASNG